MWFITAIADAFNAFIKNGVGWNQMISLSNHKISYVRHTFEGNKVVYHYDVFGASPVGAAPTTSSFST